MIDTTLLHNVTAEKEVIGACLFDTNVYEYVADELSEDLFTDYACREAYKEMQALVADGKIPEYMQVDARLKKHNLSIIEFMSEQIWTPVVTSQRVQYLQDLLMRRKLAVLFHKANSLIGDSTATMDDIRSIYKEFGMVVDDTKGGAETQSFGGVIDSLITDVVERREDRGEKGMMTGLHIFDSRFGWHGGDLIIIAGETSQGKSTLATTIASNMAYNGIPSAYYSMEMSAKQLVARMIARWTNVSSSTTLYGKLNDDEYSKVYDNTRGLKEFPIYFDEDSKTSFGKICSSIRRMVRLHGVRVVFIDYLQILANGKGDNREQLIGDMARDLKRLAVETNTAIVALSQMKRSDGGSKEPSLNRMRGSGQIEEACDMGVLIYRPNLKNETANIYLAKGRNIGLAKEKIRFNGNLSYFSDFESGDPQAPYQEKKEELPF